MAPGYGGGARMGHRVTLTVNGTSQTREIEPTLLLVEFLRETLSLTGTHVGCDTSQCGACTVLVDGRATKACTRSEERRVGKECRSECRRWAYRKQQDGERRESRLSAEL